jgi:hypothetical protein
VAGERAVADIETGDDDDNAKWKYVRKAVQI